MFSKPIFPISSKTPQYLQCPVCHVEFNENYSLMLHLFSHAAPPDEAGANPAQCQYCLTRFTSQDELDTHLKHNHPADTKSPELFTYACLICEVRIVGCSVIW